MTSFDIIVPALAVLIGLGGVGLAHLMSMRFDRKHNGPIRDHPAE